MQRGSVSALAGLLGLGGSGGTGPVLAVVMAGAAVVVAWRALRMAVRIALLVAVAVVVLHVVGGAPLI